MQQPESALANVLWIGGATDAGKTSVAGILAERHGWQVYHYDRTDVPHHERLALANLDYRRFMAASLDERWVQPTPEQLLARTLRSFTDRWPFVVEDLLAAPCKPLIVAEGFGLTPALLASVLRDRARAIMLIPSEQFKRDSMARRNKPIWRIETSDPERARENLLRRDLLLAAHLRREALALGFTVLEVDGARAVEEEADIVERHFAPVLRQPVAALH